MTAAVGMAPVTMADRRVFVGDITRKEFREGVDAGRIRAAVVPVGSTEQHHEHLAMLHDTSSAAHIGQLAAQELYPAVVVATPVPIGISEHHMQHRGTLTVRPEVFCEYVYDVCDSLRRGGLRHLLVLNGHGGNVRPMRERLDDFRARLGLPLQFNSYWDFIPEEEAKRLLQTGRYPGHAGEFETAFARAAFPERIDEASLVFDQAQPATADVGAAMIAFSVQGTVARLKEMMAG